MKHLAHHLNRTLPVQGPAADARLQQAWVGIVGSGVSLSSFGTRTTTTMNDLHPGEGSA